MPFKKRDVACTQDTLCSVEESADGLKLSVYHACYQFMPELGLVTARCKAALFSLADEVAGAKAHPLARIAEHQIRFYTERDSLSGISSCRANVLLQWRED